MKSGTPRDHVFGYTPEGYPKQILTPEEDAKYPPISLDEMRAFIKANAWTFAKTMSDTPHYYIVIHHATSQFEFRRFVAQIRRTGYAHKFFRATLKYLDVDEWYYWSMGWPIDETEILNRAEQRLQGNYVVEDS